MQDIIDAVESGNAEAVSDYLNIDPLLIEFTSYGETPLTIAAQQGQSEIARILLEHGANIDHRGNHGRTPLHFTSIRGDESITRQLLEYKPALDLPDEQGHTPLLSAAIMGNRDVAELLISHGAKYDITSATCLGDLERVKSIISEDPTAIRNCQFKNDLLSNAVVSNNVELVKFLLNQPDINPSAIGNTGEPPLITAVSRTDYNTEIVKTLLDHGANPTQPSSSGDTALTRAESVGIANFENLLQ